MAESGFRYSTVDVYVVEAGLVAEIAAREVELCIRLQRQALVHAHRRGLGCVPGCRRVSEDGEVQAIFQR